MERETVETASPRVELKQIGFRCDPAIAARLEKLAESTRRTTTSFILEALETELPRFERIYKKQLQANRGFAQASLLALVVMVFVAAGFLWVFRSVELVMALVAWVSVIKYRFMQADANLHRRLSHREIIVICIGLAVLGFSTSVWAVVEVWGMLL